MTLLAGCRRQAQRAVVSTEGFVRLEALTSTHPAWNAVQQIDRLLQQARDAARAAPAAVPSLPSVDLPAPLSIQADLYSEPPLPGPRTFRPAQARINSLRGLLAARDDRALRLQRIAGQKRVAAAVSDYEAERLASLKVAQDDIRRRNTEQQRELELKAIALETRTNTPIAGPRAENLRAWNLVREDLLRLRDSLPVALETARKQALRDIQSYRDSQEQALEQQLARVKEDLARRTAQTIAEYQTQVYLGPSSAGSIRAVSLPATKSLPVIPLPSPAQIAAARGLPAPVATASTGPAMAALVAQRRRLLDYIAEDVRRRVQEIAARNNWRVAFAPSDGSTDITDQLAARLRQEFPARGVAP